MRTINVTLHDPPAKTTAGLKQHGLAAAKSNAEPGALIVLLADEGDVAAFARFAADHADQGLSMTLDVPFEQGAAA